MTKLKNVRCGIFAWVWIVSVVGFSAAAQAQVKCFPERIKSVEVMAVGEVYYTTVSGVKRRLTHFSQYGAEAMYNLVYRSINNVQIVQVIYPEGYKCKDPDLKVDALSVILQDPRVN